MDKKRIGRKKVRRLSPNRTGFGEKTTILLFRGRPPNSEPKKRGGTPKLYDSL